MAISRRNFIQLASGSVVGLSMSGLSLKALASNNTVTLGLNIPMTGDYAPWGLPGLYGCQIVAEDINAGGGVKIGDDTYNINVVAYDHGYNTEKAVQGYKKLHYNDNAKMIMMLGGSTVASVMPFANRNETLTTTLLPSDITNDTPSLVAPCETHPLYNVTGVEWLAKNNPDLKSAVIITTNDMEYGKQSAATYAAAFEVAGIEVLAEEFHGYDVADFAPLVGKLLAHNPDVFCMATDVYTTPIVEQLYQQGYKGKIISCTLDGYGDVIAKTSKEFAEGIVFQFPDFDDPMLTSENTSFPDPARFDRIFNERHPGEWSAVAWEYPSILLGWIEAAQRAGSIEPNKVLHGFLGNDSATHTFGAAKWWGQNLWGKNNALVGDWPVVAINDGKATIQEFGSVYDWVVQNGDVLKRHLREHGITVVN
jgi:branched-chain amino acid transport system substrate-binding protein